MQAKLSSRTPEVPPVTDPARVSAAGAPHIVGFRGGTPVRQAPCWVQRLAPGVWSPAAQAPGPGRPSEGRAPPNCPLPSQGAPAARAPASLWAQPASLALLSKGAPQPRCSVLWGDQRGLRGREGALLLPPRGQSPYQASSSARSSEVSGSGMFPGTPSFAAPLTPAWPDPPALCAPCLRPGCPL